MNRSLDDIEQALRLFDETTSALSARIHRLEEVLLQKTRELAAKVSELDRLHAWLEQVMGAVASGVLAVDADGRITTANPAAEAALAGSLDPVVGADYRAAFPDSPLLRLLDGSGAVGDYERILRPAQGQRRILSCKAAPLHGPDGRCIGAVEAFEDVTEVRRLRELVDRADRLQQLGEMAAGVAHEIRNPLNGIEGFASLLARDLGDDPKGRYARLIVEGVRHLNATVTGLLEYAKPRRLERTRHDPAALLRGVAELLASDAVEAGVDLRVEATGDLPALLCDGQQLKQVLINLVRNAIQAVAGHRDHGAVDCSVALVGEDEPAVVFTVSDEGPGIPPEDRQRVFTPFFTTKDEGTGLGLAVSHTIVDLHGGQLLVEDAPGGGARLRVVIPV